MLSKLLLNISLFRGALLVLVIATVPFDSYAQQCQSARHPKVCIDNELWEFNKDPDVCFDRVHAAIKRYEEAPLFSPWRKTFTDRNLVNGTPDCWIELNIDGVDDVSYLFKVTADHEVIDQREFSYWLPHIRPYPTGPVYLDEWERDTQ